MLIKTEGRIKMWITGKDLRAGKRCLFGENGKHSQCAELMKYQRTTGDPEDLAF